MIYLNKIYLLIKYNNKNNNQQNILNINKNNKIIKK
jgi:hypothetical protein